MVFEVKSKVGKITEYWSAFKKHLKEKMLEKNGCLRAIHSKLRDDDKMLYHPCKKKMNIEQKKIRERVKEAKLLQYKEEKKKWERVNKELYICNKSFKIRKFNAN